jgi:hypothetical protein
MLSNTSEMYDFGSIKRGRQRAREADEVEHEVEKDEEIKLGIAKVVIVFEETSELVPCCKL